MSTATLERPKTAEEPKVHKILLKDLQLVETARAHFDVTLPVGIPFEESLKPEFWSNVADRFARRPGDMRDKAGSIVNIGAADHSFFGQVYVRAVRQQALVVEELFYKPLGPQEDTKSATYKTRWNVGAAGFDIIRESDGEIVGRAKDFPAKEDALSYIRDVLKG